MSDPIAAIRDLAAEVEIIRTEPTPRYEPVCEWSVRSGATPGVAQDPQGFMVFHSRYRDHVDTLFLHIAALSTEIDRLKSKANNDALSMELQRDQALRERDGLHEALQWALENGVYHRSGVYYWPDTEPMRTTLQPPAHLAPILAEAMRSKS